jgi:hypothetical protein
MSVKGAQNNTPPLLLGKKCPECNRLLAVSLDQTSVQCSFCKGTFRVIKTLTHGVKLEKIRFKSN